MASNRAAPAAAATAAAAPAAAAAHAVASRPPRPLVDLGQASISDGTPSYIFGNVIKAESFCRLFFERSESLILISVRQTPFTPDELENIKKALAMPLDPAFLLQRPVGGTQVR